MNQPINLDNPSFTAFAAGELDGAELDAFQAMLADPCAQKELDETEKMISLLTDGFRAEWKEQVAPFGEESLTAYALNELDSDEMDIVEAMIDDSPGSADDLAGIEEMMGLLSESLEGEWRARESVNLDVPAFTDYALGELSGVEAAEFETVLKYSSTAVKELGATRDMVSLLSEGLEKEWKSELSSADHEFSLVEATGEENVVSVNFAQATSGSVRSQKNRSHALISLAAVLAGTLVVIGMLQQAPQTGQKSVAAAIGFSSDGHVWFDSSDTSTEIAEVPMEPVINLRLLEELNQPIQDFELPDDELAGIDFCIPEPDMATSSGMQLVRADSYLPGKGNLAYTVKDVLIGMNSHSVFFNHCPEILTFPGGSGFDLNSSGGCATSEMMSKEEVLEEFWRVREELQAISSDLGSANGDFQSLQLRLNRVLEQYRELGSHLDQK